MPAARRPPASAGRGGGSLRFAEGLFAAGVLVTALIIILTASGPTSAPPKPKPLPPPAKLPRLTERFQDRLLGVTGLATRHWVVGGVGPILHLVSSDHKAAIVIGAPGATRTADAALHVAISVIRQAYSHVTLKQAIGSVLGGRPARSVVMYGTNKAGAQLRILLATAKGRKLAYVMQAFTARNASLRVLEESQQIIATLRFQN